MNAGWACEPAPAPSSASADSVASSQEQEPDLPRPREAHAWPQGHAVDAPLRTLIDSEAEPLLRSEAARTLLEASRSTLLTDDPADAQALVAALEALRTRWSAADPALAGVDLLEHLDALLAAASEREPVPAAAAYLAATALQYRTSRPQFESRALALLERATASPSADRAFALGRAAEVARGSNDYESALLRLSAAHALLEQFDVREDTHALRGTRAYLELQTAALHTALGRPDEALESCERAQHWLDSSGPWPAPPTLPHLVRFASVPDLMLLNRLGALLSVGRFSAMLSVIDAHGPISRDFAPSVALYRGMALRARNDLEGAQRELETALASPVLAASPKAMALLELALVEQQRGQLEHARASLERAREHLAKHPRLVLPLARLHGLEIAFELGDEPSATAAQVVLERARAAWRSVLETWDRTPLDGSGVGFLGFPHRRMLLGQLIELELRAAPGTAGREHAFERLLEGQARGTSCRRMTAGPITLDDVRAELCGRGRGVLVFLPAWSGSHVFAVDERELVHARLPAHEQLGEALNEAWAQLRDGGPTTRVDALGPQLLPPSIQARLREWSAIAVVGTDLLRHFPLDALRLEDGRRIGLVKQVWALPSLPAAVALARRPPAPAPEGIRWVGSPLMDAELTRAQRLAPVELEASAARSLERLRPPLERFEGPRATLSALRAPPQVLAVFTHGLVDRTLPRPNGLALTSNDEDRDGAIFFDDVQRALRGSSAPSVVLLMSCGSARTTTKLGDDDSDQLGTAFLESGARCVVVSAEPLHQVATARLGASMLQHLANGASPAEALMRARVELTADARWEHPRFWATWGLFGLGSR